MKAYTVIPGLSDHKLILADCDIRAASARKQPRSVFKWGKADWGKIKEDLAAFRDRFIPANKCRSVVENHNCWMKSFIPTKLLKDKQYAPWFNNGIKRMCKKKQWFLALPGRLGNHLPGRATRPSRGTPWKSYVKPAGPTWMIFLVWVWVRGIPNPSGNTYVFRDKTTSVSRSSREMGIWFRMLSAFKIFRGVARLAGPNYPKLILWSYARREQKGMWKNS